jgi:hypothetical protein
MLISIKPRYFSDLGAPWRKNGWRFFKILEILKNLGKSVALTQAFCLRENRLATDAFSQIDTRLQNFHNFVSAIRQSGHTGRMALNPRQFFRSRIAVARRK